MVCPYLLYQKKFERQHVIVFFNDSLKRLDIKRFLIEFFKDKPHPL